MSRIQIRATVSQNEPISDAVATRDSTTEQSVAVVSISKIKINAYFVLCSLPEISHCK